MNTHFGNLFAIFLLSLQIAALQVSAMPIWPIRPNEDPDHDRVNCTFCEIHPTGGAHFHYGIDIDCTLGVHPKPIEHGIVLNIMNHVIQIGHGTPDANGRYPRKTVIHEFDPAPNLQAGNLVEAGVTELGTIIAPYGHLHFEMWQHLEGDRYYLVNPLKNDADWALPFQQYVIDIANPQVNNIFLQIVNQQADVASGYLIPQPRSGAILDYANNSAAKVHIQNRPGSNGPLYNPMTDNLIVFGSVGAVVNTRDVNINHGSIGDGITIHRLNYQINAQSIYDITFDRIIADEDRLAFDETFHIEWNTPIVPIIVNGRPRIRCDSSDRFCGNNDFIELWKGPNENYLYPHKTMTVHNLNSNGIWYTKARITDTDGDEQDENVYVFDNAHLPEIARSNLEALYPDREHTLTFHVEDAAGRIDRAKNKAEDNAKVTVIVDNFKPFVKKVEVVSGDRSTQSI